MNSVALAPVIGIFSIFFFVLLIVLLVKKPKAGAWVVSAVVLIPLAVSMLRGMRGGMVHPGFLPVVGIGGCFVFVLLLVMLHHTPRAAVGLIVAIVVAFGTMFAMRSVYGTHDRPATVSQRTQRSYVRPHSEVVYQGFRQPGYSVIDGEPRSEISYADTGQPAVTAPIWSEGVEDQYEADAYPSKRASAGGLGPKLKEWIQRVTPDANEPIKIVLFQEQNDRYLIWELERSLEQALSGVDCSIESGSRNIDRNEIGVTLRFQVSHRQRPSWENQGQTFLDEGWAIAEARHRDQQTTVTQNFSEKPWADDFSSFVNERSDRHFLVARSRSACTSENEAKRQAEADACRQLSLRLAETFPRSFPNQAIPVLTPAQLRDGGFVVDQFLQSFDGLSGRLWRQAMLIDVGDQKMARLERDTRIGMRVERMSWARMILSSIGALAIIVLSYLFLNMATRGYYAWSLRIAGVVLAIAGIVSIILVLR